MRLNITIIKFPCLIKIIVWFKIHRHRAVYLTNSNHQVMACVTGREEYYPKYFGNALTETAVPPDMVCARGVLHTGLECTQTHPCYSISLLLPAFTKQVSVQRKPWRRRKKCYNESSTLLVPAPPHMLFPHLHPAAKPLSLPSLFSSTQIIQHTYFTYFSPSHFITSV